MNYYEIIGVSEDATQEEIEEAYRHQVKVTHPDQSDHPNAVQLFKRLQQAYDVLGDPESRDAYDSNEDPPDPSETIGGWRDNVRGHDLADPIWTVEYPRTVYPPGPEITESSSKNVIGRIVMAVAGGVMGLGIGTMGLSMITDSPSLLSGTPFDGAGFMLLVVPYLVLLIGVERFTNTQRKIVDL
ncbi:J domain-containing protein [Halorubrum sp. LN27]|uniref:J domain-containing protein n=1 Tax=Halorubrum sp. LN27 TaxID=2801032 RepID=UPI00190D2B03|nr:J domain-containing protein [Halorubrum sp. LN27]